MKYLYTTIILTLLVIFGVWFLYSKQQTPSVENTSNLSHYSNDTYGISFSYPSDYVLEEHTVTGITGKEYHQVSLINKKDLPLPVNGEGPTAITIDFHPNDIDKYTAEGWARNSKDSNLRLGEGRLATTTISGFPAVSFRWSGLYEGTTIVLANPKWIYTFNVTYLEMGAQIVQDFVKIRDSVQISK